MKLRTRIVFLIFNLLSMALLSQQTNYNINNVNLKLSQNRLLVKYDLFSKKSHDPVTVRLLFYDDQYRIYVPKTIQPDSRKPISPGKNRSISWDFAKDMQKISVDLHPYLIPGNIANHNFGMGTEAALFSVLIPGMGNYFVGDTRNQSIKPWMKTIGSYGLILLGTYAARERFRKEPIYSTDGKKWKMGAWNYRYFENDAEILIGTGIAIWITDIVLVAIKGNHNAKLKRNILGMNIVYR